MKKKMTVLVAALVCGLCAFADVTVSDVQVFSGHPWKEVVVGYTIAGTAGETSYLRLTATDRDANKTYGATTLIGEKLTPGRHVVRWNAAAEDVKFSSTNVVFTVAVDAGGVQLWENGPYWAECNVGASKPEDYGYYFWWGDAVGYKRNSADDGWISVKDGSGFTFVEENCPTYGKDSAQLRSAGYIGESGNLVFAHDAATAYFGAPWRLPTEAEVVALTNNCNITRTYRSGVGGILVCGRGAYASKSIFLPGASSGDGSDLKGAGGGYYWSSTPNYTNLWTAFCLFFSYSDKAYRSAGIRYIGFPVRPVRGSFK